jgi:putative protease
VTASYDLNLTQLESLLQSAPASWFEVTIHQHMPLFHMEHCVFARELSSGTSYKDCGRPCERHALSLRDRAGLEHPVLADVGCRNTVFHAKSQSAASLVAALREAGVRRYRIELVREDAGETRKTVAAYRALLDGRATGADVYRRLDTESTYGVVRGSLRVLGQEPRA